jgi:hypothetical protein
MLTIGRHRFEIARAELRAYVSIGAEGWGVNWDLEISAHPLESDDTWEPRLRTHGSLTNLPHPNNLPGTRLGPLGRDPDGEPVFLLYIFEHEPVDDVILTFGDRRRSDFFLKLTGTTANYDDIEGADTVPIRLECWTTFVGVTVDEGRLENARARLAQFFGESGWLHTPEGVRYVFRLSRDS